MFLSQWLSSLWNRNGSQIRSEPDLSEGAQHCLFRLVVQPMRLLCKMWKETFGHAGLVVGATPHIAVVASATAAPQHFLFICSKGLESCERRWSRNRRWNTQQGCRRRFLCSCLSGCARPRISCWDTFKVISIGSMLTQYWFKQQNGIREGLCRGVGKACHLIWEIFFFHNTWKSCTTPNAYVELVLH